MKTKLEIINETAEYYSADVNRRAVYQTPIGVKCRYITDDGRMCAVGRCLIDPTYLAISNFPIQHYRESGFFKLLKPEYAQEDLQFWIRLQNFHDELSYWDNIGLTNMGQHCLELLRKDYASA